MPDDAMTISERRKYLERMEGRYRRADRLGQGQLLDEMEAMTGLHRKSLLRLLGPGGSCGSRGPGSGAGCTGVPWTMRCG
jgi:hypothetical protein